MIYGTHASRSFMPSCAGNICVGCGPSFVFGLARVLAGSLCVEKTVLKSIAPSCRLALCVVAGHSSRGSTSLVHFLATSLATSFPGHFLGQGVRTLPSHFPSHFLDTSKNRGSVHFLLATSLATSSGHFLGQGVRALLPLHGDGLGVAREPHALAVEHHHLALLLLLARERPLPGVP